MEDFRKKMWEAFKKALSEKLNRCQHTSTSTQFRAMSVFDAVSNGTMSFKEYSRLSAKDLAPLTTCLSCGKQWYN